MAANRSRLGRGLGALLNSGGVDDTPGAQESLGTAHTPHLATDGKSATGHSAIARSATGHSDGPVAVAGGFALMIEVNQIAANPHQPRRNWNDSALAGLAESIKTSGIIQPVLVRTRKDDPNQPYELIAGERRLRAAKLAGQTSIPALLREATPLEQAQIALIENIQRADLNALERGAAYQELIRELGLSQADLALRMGEDRTTIAHYVRLLDLPENAREFLRDGKISQGHAKILLGVDDILEQESLADQVVAHDLSVRNLQRLIDSRNGQYVNRPQHDKITPHTMEIEKVITREIGLKVQVRARGTKGRGRLVVHYNSLDQFDMLMERLKVKLPEE